MRLALIIEYEGTRYHGFQFQTNASSIQEELEKAIEKLTGERVRVQGAGRTDTGVHALGQVVAFDTQASHRIETFVKALNFYLTEDIAVQEAYSAGDNFDPRRDAISREYRYTIHNGPMPSPLQRRFSYHMREPLDTGAMQKAALLLEGEHDFLSFSGRWQDDKSTRRRVRKARVCREKDKVIFNVEGNAFLRQQVRKMAGALVQVGLGRMSALELQTLLRCGKKEAAPVALPAKGLCLMRVHYKDFPPEVGKKDDNKHKTL